MARQSLENEDFTKTKSVLEEDASIYQKRGDETEKEKWKSLDGKEKRQYFSDYYLLKILLAVGILVGIGYVVYVFLTPKPPVAMYAAYLYGAVDEKGAEQTEKEFAEAAGIPLDELQVIISDDFYLDDRSGLSALEKLLSYAYSDQIDIVIAEEEEFYTMASGGNLMCLSTLLDEEFYSEIEDETYWCELSPEYLDGEQDDTEYPFGVYITDSEVYEKIGCTELEKPIMGIMVNQRGFENGIRFFRYMLGYDIEPMTQEELDMYLGKEEEEEKE